MCLLTDSLLAGQWTLQGHASRRQVWTGAGLKHGGDVEGLRAQTQNMSGHIHRPHTRTDNHSLFITTFRDPSGENEGESLLFKLSSVNREQRETNPVKTEITVVRDYLDSDFSNIPPSTP